MFFFRCYFARYKSKDLFWLPCQSKQCRISSQDSSSLYMDWKRQKNPQKMSVYNFTLATVGLKILSCPEVCLFKMLKQRWTLSRSVVCGFNSLCAMRLIYMQTMKSYTSRKQWLQWRFLPWTFFSNSSCWQSWIFFFFLGITKTERSLAFDLFQWLWRF